MTGEYRHRLAKPLSWTDLVPLAALLVPVALIVARSLDVGLECAALGGPVDARFVGYVLEWGYLHLHGEAMPQGSLWSPPFFYPVPRILAYSENLFAGYPLYFPLRWAGLEPATALFVFHVVHRALTPVVTYLCLRALRLGRWPSFVGAAIFAWGWIRYFHFGHLQFSAGYVIPLFFTALYLFVRRRRPWAVVLAAWTFLFTWHFSLYTAVFLLFGTVVLAVVYCLLPGGWRQLLRAGRSYARLGTRHRRQAVAILLLCGTAAVLLVPSALVYLDVHREYGPASEEQVRIYWGDPLSWVRPPPQHLVLGRLSSLFPQGAGNNWEKRVFVGWLGLAGLLLPAAGFLLRGSGIYPLWPRSLVSASIAGSGMMVVFSQYGLRWLEAPFWLLHDHFPGMGGLRAPSRIAFVVSWFVVLCAAVHLERLLRRRAVAALAVGLGLLLLVENVAPPPRIVDRCRDEAIWRQTARHLCPQIPRQEVGTLLFLPIGIHSLRHIIQNSLAMQLSLHCELNVVNGYSGRRPTLLKPLLGSPAAVFPCPAVRELVDRVHRESGQGVLVHLDQGAPQGPARYPAAAVERCLQECSAPPPEWYDAQPGRPAWVFVTRPDRSCEPPSG